MLADKNTVYAFFETFARFECVMKMEERFCDQDSYGLAKPNWTVLKEEFGPKLRNPKNTALENAIKYLLDKPPKIQFKRDGKAVYDIAPLRDPEDGAKVLEAAKRVRNNLFHGGKITGLSPQEERNNLLLKHAQVIIVETSKICPKFQQLFEDLRRS